jgi:hypothetical protein
VTSGQRTEESEGVSPADIWGRWSQAEEMGTGKFQSVLGYQEQPRDQSGSMHEGMKRGSDIIRELMGAGLHGVLQDNSRFYSDEISGRFTHASAL